MQASGCGWGRPLLDLRVSVTGGVHFDLVKRVLRDISRSGQAPEEIIQQARHVALEEPWSASCTFMVACAKCI